MAVPRKLVIAPNSATRELWRIADSGEMDELAAVLPQADVNARNEHGMTALMRASRRGHVQMVRMLLECGADSNVTRNDNFTALSLAAFFGHAESVEMLMRHGANSEVSTRFGTSPQMWARARSFGDVARCLEKRRREKKSVSSVAGTASPVQPFVCETPAPTQPPAPVVAPAPAVVRTLKEPPEIWDLVQEAPKNFDARSAFMTRIGSMKSGLVMAVAAVLVIACAGIGAMLLMKEKVPPVAAPAVTAAAPVSPPASASRPAETIPTPESNAGVVEPPVVANETASAEVNTTVPRRTRPVAKSRGVSNEFNGARETIQTFAAPPVVAAPTFEPPPSAAAETKKRNAPVSPQVISAPKAAPSKVKVIQWP